MVAYRLVISFLEELLRSRCDVSGCWKERFPPRDLRSYLAMARPSQERVEASQVLPVRFRPESRLRLRESLPLRAGRQSWY